MGVYELYSFKITDYHRGEKLKTRVFGKKSRCTVPVGFCIFILVIDLCIMYIKSVIRTKPGTFEVYTYYRLCESYRDETGRSTWRNVMGLGRMENFTNEQRGGFVTRLNEMLRGEPGLFIAADDPRVEAYSREIFNKLVDTGKTDLPDILSGARHRRMLEEKRDLVKASSIRHGDVREIGSEHLCYETARRLELDSFFLSHGFNMEETALALTQIVARAVHPGSELATAKWIRERSAVCTLSGFQPDKINKDKLYAGALKLFDNKDALEDHLSRCTSDLFGLEDKIIIFDLTNTYFEGAMRGSRIARFGRSKEKRNDCKLLVLALVINAEGFPKHYSLFEGNMSDPKSLLHIIEGLDRKSGGKSEHPKTVVMDAGIATGENLELLRELHYDYICVSRKRLTGYEPVEESNPVIIRDRLNQPIELLSVKASGDNSGDRFIQVRSRMKALKEYGMAGQATSRYEMELAKISASLTKKGGTRRVDKVNRRIGRAQQKYPSVQSRYEVELKCSGNIATDLVWRKKDEDKELKGIYFLRTTLDEKREEFLWQIYNIIREVEYSFSVLKTDLELRPIYHKKDQASLAHLHLGILAYWLVVTIRHQLKAKGIRLGWKQILEVMDSHKLVTSTMKTSGNEEVEMIRCSEPGEQVKNIYQAVKITEVPFKPKKSVRYQLGFQKKSDIEYQIFNSS